MSTQFTLFVADEWDARTFWWWGIIAAYTDWRSFKSLVIRLVVGSAGMAKGSTHCTGFAKL